MTVAQKYTSVVSKAADKLNEFNGLARPAVAFAAGATTGLVYEIVLPEPAWTLAGIFGFAVGAATGWTAADIAMKASHDRAGEKGPAYYKDLAVTGLAMIGGLLVGDALIPDAEEPQADTLGAIVEQAPATEVSSTAPVYYGFKPV